MQGPKERMLTRCWATRTQGNLCKRAPDLCLLVDSQSDIRTPNLCLLVAPHSLVAAPVQNLSLFPPEGYISCSSPGDVSLICFRVRNAFDFSRTLRPGLR